MTKPPYVTEETLALKTSRWLEAIAPWNTHAMKLRVEKAALLVIDMQNFFLTPTSPTFACGGVAVLGKTAQLVSAFREAQRPVIFTKHVHHPSGLDAGLMGQWWEGMCVEGSPESEIHPLLSPMPREKVIHKHRYSAFYNTDLETVLRCLRIEDLVVTGVLTNLCCESTARDAYFRDFRVFFPADATGSIEEEMHLGSLRTLAFGFSYVTETSALLSMLLP